MSGPPNSKLIKAQQSILSTGLYKEGYSFTSSAMNNHTGIHDICLINSALAVLSNKKFIEEVSRQNYYIQWRRRMANPMLRLPWTPESIGQELQHGHTDKAV